MKKNGVKNLSNLLKLYCKYFEDYSGALELEVSPKLQQSTNNITVVYHHFL